MGRIHSLPHASRERRAVPRLAPALRRALDVGVAATLLVLTVPLLALAALAVRVSSNGPVLQRTRARTRNGANVELLAFRTLIDGGGTRAHAQLRAVVGDDDAVVVTGVGRVLQATRLHRLPRLVNVVAGHSSFFASGR